MKTFKAMAHIHSLNGEMDEITVLDKEEDGTYIVDYRGVICYAILNPFNWQYYVDDIYEISEQEIEI